jgi:AraC family transcriptional regulator
MLVLDPQMIAHATDGELDAATALEPEVDTTRPAILWAMRVLARQVQEPGPGGRLQAETMATAILLELVRHRTVRDDHYRATAGRNAPGLRRFAEHVEAHLADDLSLFALAATAGLSPAHLTRELRRVTGLSPHQYVLRRRAERARVLIAGRRRGISAIALEAGFSSQAHLNVVFRRVYGVTPGEYRKYAMSGS